MSATATIPRPRHAARGQGRKESRAPARWSSRRPARPRPVPSPAPPAGGPHRHALISPPWGSAPPECLQIPTAPTAVAGANPAWPLMNTSQESEGTKAKPPGTHRELPACQGPPSAQWTLGSGPSQGDSPGHCGRLSSTPGPPPLNARSSLCRDNHGCPRTPPGVLWGHSRPRREPPLDTAVPFPPLLRAQERSGDSEGSGGRAPATLQLPPGERTLPAT